MCGIVGYIGQEQAAPILLRGLAKLEYRGYDSAGLAVRNDSGELEIVKAKGRLTSLVEKTDEGRAVQGRSGVGHTRWATHGEPSEMNAHPHATDDGEIALVHNGIIENYQELKDKLVRAGYRFHSQTDTEAAVKLVDYYYRRNHDPLEAISRAMLRIRGSCQSQSSTWVRDRTGAAGGTSVSAKASPDGMPSWVSRFISRLSAWTAVRTWQDASTRAAFSAATWASISLRALLGWLPASTSRAVRSRCMTMVAWFSRAQLSTCRASISCR